MLTSALEHSRADFLELSLPRANAPFTCSVIFKHLNSATPPCLPSTGRPPARPSQAQAGSSSDRSPTVSILTQLLKELPRLGQRKEGEALPGSLSPPLLPDALRRPGTLGRQWSSCHTVPGTQVCNQDTGGETLQDPLPFCSLDL